jgi:hypothetical protein
LQSGLLRQEALSLAALLPMSGGVSNGTSGDREVHAPEAAATSQRARTCDSGKADPDPESTDGADAWMHGRTVAEGELSDLATCESHHWGRIIRQPRKRSKHVILDICTPVAALPRHHVEQLADQDSGTWDQPKGSAVSRHGNKRLGMEGMLVQQVVASADKRGWLGPAGYRLARKACWGDLWPTYYANRAIITKLGPRRSKPECVLDS